MGGVCKLLDWCLEVLRRLVKQEKGGTHLSSTTRNLQKRLPIPYLSSERSLAVTENMTAEEKKRRWLILEALGRPVVPEV